MHHYGLTDEEKQTHLQQYNHALFQNSLSFMDIIWEINLLFGTVVILEDKARPQLGRTERSYDDFLSYCIAELVPQDEAAAFLSHMSFEKLDHLRDEDVFYARLYDEDHQPQLYRIVLTPAIDERGILFCVYLGALRIHDQPRDKALLPQELFRDALLSNCYFSYHFDLTEGGLIWEDFAARDGTHPIRDATGLPLPIPYSTWLRKWHELYQPEFDRQEAQDCFSVEHFLRCFAQKEQFLQIEVKQKNPASGKPEYMHMIALLLEDPADHHVHACIIWRAVDAFHSRAMEDRLGLERRNERLQRSVSRDDQFRRAALSGALMVYNINLTKNLIEDEFYEIVDGTHYPMLQLVGLTAPCSFDIFCQRWNEAKVPEDSKETFRTLYNRQYLLDSYAKGIYQLEIEFDTTIGRGIPVTLRNTILLTKDMESGEILAMVNAKDVTAQRKEERDKRQALQAAYDAARRANAAKSDFLARMSHDIRTPMNAIVGMTAIASTHLDDPARVTDCLNKINQASKHLLGLINDVLDMSKIESGKLRLQEENFVLTDLIDSLVDLCRPQSEARRHTLDVRIHDVQHDHVIGDSQHIQQAFVNLLSNAIKYTPDGGEIRLCVTEKPTNRPGVGCYEFVFQDNGIGMDESFLAHLFEPFERAPDVRAQKEQGTGLGMAITKNLVQMMNGKIQVESALNQGTKFTVTIFLRFQDQRSSVKADAEKSSIAALAASDYSGKRALLVEDNELNAEIAEEILSMVGLTVERVVNGQEAVEAISRVPDGYYDIVLMDIQMPVMDGFTAARAIRALGRSYTDTVPILAVSANAFAEDVEEAKSAGMNDHIAKPLDFARLRSALDKWL